ncbi:MAG: hypothetical protein ABFS32_02750 [Bacteroidota bacterium]
MKRTIILGILLSAILYACDEVEPKVLVADFETTITGEAPNAQVSITNNSENASSFSWTFTEGADVESSTEETPSILSIDKADDFTITLVVSDGSAEKEISKTVSIIGNSAIVEHSDLEFSLNAGDATYGRLYSFETSTMYLDSEVTADNGSKIHLAFGSMGQTMYYFDSPDVAGYNVPNATTTKVTNYESTPTVSDTDFAAMADDRLLADLTIVNDDESFGNSMIPGNTVLFETSTGRKGVVITKEVNSDRLLVDIKIQKY